MKRQGCELATRVGDGITGVGGSSGARSRKARRGAPPVISLNVKRQTPIQVANRHVGETRRGARCGLLGAACVGVSPCVTLSSNRGKRLR
jgi:hypothetical protein